MLPDKTTEWNEGRAAYEAGEPESKCPYGMLMQWTRWADWVCGYGEAKQEAFAKALAATSAAANELQPPETDHEK